MEKVSVMIIVVLLETDTLEVGDVVSVLEALLDEEEVDVPEVSVLEVCVSDVCVPEADEPDELVAVPPGPVAEEAVKLVDSVVTEFINEEEEADENALP
ncbi:hypothetical protein F4859DRAFT_465407 [Xylaria cf. heliscus]|nr:hypothetical protein F4859DRAFT_465407 [Xylaria cf. heliscus]